ncbi:Hypothetical protein A7982_05144 [Minicystis rosea]|nr:Hypothetical protein A7982_05144 [Minicystis rosea]
MGWEMLYPANPNGCARTLGRCTHEMPRSTSLIVQAIGIGGGNCTRCVSNP